MAEAAGSRLPASRPPVLVGESIGLAAKGLVKNVTPLLIRPSQDLALLSKDHIKEVPFHFRQLLRSTANPEELGNLLSYLLFSHGYLNELMALGKRDADSHRAELENFVRSFE